MSRLAMTPFALWMYAYLRNIKKYRKNIHKYREAGDMPAEIEEIRKVVEVWSTAVTDKIGMKLRVSGLENIPEGPVVFVSNHQSYTDIPALGATIGTRHQLGFVAKENLGKLPLFGGWIADIRSVFIQREDARASLQAIQEGIALLEQGFSLVLFPEGTRSKGPEMGSFKKGSLRLATKPQIPIVPVTLSGTYRCYEAAERVRPGTVDIFIHPPVSTAGLSKPQAASLSDEIEELLRSKLKELQS